MAMPEVSARYIRYMWTMPGKEGGEGAGEAGDTSREGEGEQ